MKLSPISFNLNNQVKNDLNFKSVFPTNHNINSPYIDEFTPKEKLQQQFPLPDFIQAGTKYEDWFYSELNRRIMAFDDKEPVEVYNSFVKCFEVKK